MEERMISSKLKAFAKRFKADKSGLSAVEYGLLASGIVLAITISLAGIGTDLSKIFGDLSTDIKTASTAND
jgi:pilus assembly protein Flp/PilA